MGPFGSGKSSGCVIEISTRAKLQKPNNQNIRRTRWAVIRNSYVQLRDTTIKTFHYWLPPHECGEWRATDHDYILTSQLPDGTQLHSEILFRALDRPDQISNLLSMELTGAWVNEAREVPKAIIDALQGRVGRFPPAGEEGCTFAGIFMDTNPPDTDHWWYKLFEEFDPLKGEVIELRCMKCGKVYNFRLNRGTCPHCGMRHIRIFKQPSGRSKQAENIRNLPPNYYQNLMIGKDTNFIKVYVDGEYGYVQDGRPVYPNYVDSEHVAKETLKGFREYPLIIAWDFGLTPACVITQLTPRGCLNVLHEFVSESMAIRQFARNIVKPFLISKYAGFNIISVADWAGNARAETDERTCFQELKDVGITTVMARTNNYTARIGAVDAFLTRFVEGHRGLQLNPECKVLRKGFNSGYRFRRMQVAGDERYQDVPEKNLYSHIHDCLQYAAMEADQDIQQAERNLKSQTQYENIQRGQFVDLSGFV
jgi:hypothetical protein